MVSITSPNQKTRSGGSFSLRLLIGAGLLAALLVVLPIAGVGFMAVGDVGPLWAALWQSVLPTYIGTTFALLLCVGSGTLVIGVGTAWLVAACRFPGRTLLSWALLLPLAMPAYVVAYAATDFLDYAGPVQIALRSLGGFSSPHEYWFPEVRSFGGAVTVLTLVLYPYVYLSARAAFAAQSGVLSEIARTLGHGPWAVFTRVALPLARPAIVVGLALALMETLNDFGTVDFFAVRTLSAGLYDVWLTFESRAGAAQIALTMLGFIALLLALERIGRRAEKRYGTARRELPPITYELAPAKAWLALVACALPVLLGFVVPALVLANLALQATEGVSSAAFLTATGNTLLLAGLAAVVTVVFGVIIAYGTRLIARGMGDKIMRGASRIAGLGYALPGAVLAVGLIWPIGLMDQGLAAIGIGPLLSGTIFVLVLAYAIRFLALAHGTVEAGLERITPHMDMAARTLGAGPLAAFFQIHMPMMRGALATAALLVFVDCMKELPATLLLRPFNFETLASLAYTYASLEQLEDAAPAALAIVAAGIVPVILMSRAVAKGTTPQH